MFESSVNSDGTQTALAQASQGYRFESSVNSDGTQTRSTDRPANGGSNGGAAVVRAMAMPFFLLSANIFYILLWKKERKGAIITHISAYDAFCADISHYDRYNRAVMLSPPVCPQRFNTAVLITLHISVV